MLDKGINFDDIHYNISKLDSYNKQWNICWSPRELGKSTAIDVQKVYKQWKENGWPAVYLFNQQADMSEGQMMSVENTINKFKGREVHLSCTKDSNSIWLIWNTPTNGTKKDRSLFCVFASVSAPIRRFKGLNIGPISCIIYDEFIVNTKQGERYPDNLAFKLKEIYKTFVRECRPRLLKVYCFGNPYSKYHPLLVDLKCPINSIKKGTTLVGDNYVLDAAVLSPELRQFILDTDPNHNFDDTYEKYAFDGDAINDEDVNVIEKQPPGYKLYLTFKAQDRYLYCYRCEYEATLPGAYAFKYWCMATDQKPSPKRDVLSLNFESMTKDSKLTAYYKGIYIGLKCAIALNTAAYSSPEAYYLAQLIYAAL